MTKIIVSLTAFLLTPWFCAAETSPVPAASPASVFIADWSLMKGFGKFDKLIINGVETNLDSPDMTFEIKVESERSVLFKCGGQLKRFTASPPTQVKVEDLDPENLAVVDSTFGLGSLKDGTLAFEYPKDFFTKENVHVPPDADGIANKTTYRVDLQKKRVFVSTASWETSDPKNVQTIDTNGPLN